jgi:hypothetical protein
MDVDEYCGLIQDYPRFDLSSNVRGELFTYSTVDDPRLSELRDTYGLGQVAGEGDCWSKATRLLSWTFEQLFHVGRTISPEPRDALNILAHRKTGSLFCIHKSIVLNEALLSVGLPSRLLWCYPYEFDSDCHVVVLVYVPELGKWAVLDPAFNTYFHGDDGAPSSVLEVRGAYASGSLPAFRSITIDKRWKLVMNGVTCETYDRFYQLYMAKNCFRFSSPADSRVGCSTDLQVRRVFLNPKGFTTTNQYDSSTRDPASNVYITSAYAFFAQP